ncbi:hypothetical protein IAT38_004598 [Cryptococcus sp. DSM 104549]
MPPKGSTLHPPKPPPDAPLSAAAEQQKSHMAGLGDLELPKTTLMKLAKGSIPDNVKMQQEVLLALIKGSTLFISYLTAAAQDQAAARSGKTITASDVIKAITDLDFGPADTLVPLMEHELAAYRALQQKAKASKKPPGPGRGRGPRTSNARRAQAADEDVEMGEGVEDDDEVDEVEDDEEVAEGADESMAADGGDDDRD